MSTSSYDTIESDAARPPFPLNGKRLPYPKRAATEDVKSVSQNFISALAACMQIFELPGSAAVQNSFPPLKFLRFFRMPS